MWTARILVALLAMTFALPAIAESPEAAIKYRQAVMRAQGGHMSALAAIMKGEVDHKDHLAAHAEGIAATSEMVPVLFPGGSEMGETDALPEIWKNPEQFQKAVDALTAAAPKLEAAGMSGDMEAVKAAFGEVGKACKGCHDEFRKKKQ